MAEIDFRTTSLAELTRSVRAKEISARELTQAALDRIQRLDPTYNAFVAVDGERALAEADGIDAQHRRRRRPRAAGRDPARGQGPAERHRLHHHLRLGPPRRRPARHRRRSLRRPHAGGRLRGRRQDQHARVRLDGQHDQRHLRPLTEPVRPFPGTRRIVGRCGGGAGGRHGPARHRIRRRRVHPHPERLLRPGGHEAEPRPRPLRRPQPARLARPLDQRPHGPPRRRRRPRPRCRRRPRPHRPALAPPARGQLAGRPRRRPRPGQDRLRPHPRLRHGRRRGGRGLRARRRGARVTGRRGRRVGFCF